MKKIDLDKHFLDLDGKPAENQDKMSKTFAEALAYKTSKKIDALKAWDMATRLYKDGHIIVDESDYRNLCSFLEEITTLTPIAKAQLSQALENCTEADLTVPQQPQL